MGPVLYIKYTSYHPQNWRCRRGHKEKADGRGGIATQGTDYVQVALDMEASDLNADYDAFQVGREGNDYEACALTSAGILTRLKVGHLVLFTCGFILPIINVVSSSDKNLIYLNKTCGYSF